MNASEMGKEMAKDQKRRWSWVLLTPQYLLHEEVNIDKD